MGPRRTVTQPGAPQPEHLDAVLCSDNVSSSFGITALSLLQTKHISRRLYIKEESVGPFHRAVMWIRRGLKSYVTDSTLCTSPSVSTFFKLCIFIFV